MYLRRTPIRSWIPSPAMSNFFAARRSATDFPTSRAPRLCQHFRNDVCISRSLIPLKGMQIPRPSRATKKRILREGQIKSKSPFAMLAFPTSRF